MSKKSAGLKPWRLLSAFVVVVLFGVLFLIVGVRALLTPLPLRKGLQQVSLHELAKNPTAYMDGPIEIHGFAFERYVANASEEPAMSNGVWVRPLGYTGPWPEKLREVDWEDPVKEQIGGDRYEMYEYMLPLLPGVEGAKNERMPPPFYVPDEKNMCLQMILPKRGVFPPGFKAIDLPKRPFLGFTCYAGEWTVRGELRYEGRSDEKYIFVIR